MLVAALTSLGASVPVRAQIQQVSGSELSATIDNGVAAVKDAVGSVTAKRDTSTLVLGGAAGVLGGWMVSHIINIELLGMSVMPLLGLAGGLYLANEGHLDHLRSMLP